MTDIYQLRVKGHLDERWSKHFGGLAIHLQKDGTTLLVGPIIDQASLYGLIGQIRDLGLSLLAVHRVGASGCA